MVPGPRFRCVCLAGTRTLAFLWAKGSGNGSPWRGPPHFNPAGIQSWREPARAEKPSRRIPSTPPKSGCARGSDPPSPHRVCASLPPNRAHRVPDEGDPGGKLGAPAPPRCRDPKGCSCSVPWLGRTIFPARVLAPNPQSPPDLLPSGVARTPPPALGAQSPLRPPTLLITPATPPILLAPSTHPPRAPSADWGCTCRGEASSPRIPGQGSGAGIGVSTSPRSPPQAG